MEKRETILIPRGSAGEDPNFYVGLNGKNYVLPKGKQSEVPAAVAAEIRRAWKAQETLDATVERLSN